MNERIVRVRELLVAAHDLLEDERQDGGGPLVHRAERMVRVAIAAVDSLPAVQESGSAA